MKSFLSTIFKKRSIKEEVPNYFKGIDAYKTGCSLDNKREFDEALLYFDLAIKNGVQEAYQRRGHCLQSLGFYIDSIEDFTKAIEFYPKDCNLYFCRAIARHQIGDLALAISDKMLAIEYSKLDSDLKNKQNEKAKELGSNTITEYYEIYMASWEADLSFDIQMRDKYNKIKATGLEKDINYANQLLQTHASVWESFKKKRF